MHKALEINPSFARDTLLAGRADYSGRLEGLKLLERAVKNGFRDRRRLMDPAFAKLEDIPAFRNLLKVFGHQSCSQEVATAGSAQSTHDRTCHLTRRRSE